MPAKKSLFWLLFVTLVPVLGFIIYMCFRALAKLIQILDDPTQVTRRETPLKHPFLKKSPLPTLYASDLSKQTALEPEQDIPALSEHLFGMTKYIITVSSGIDLGKEFILDNLPSRIGRGAQASIRLDGDLGVSRDHAEIYAQAGNIKIRDLKSTHGTWVNGVRIIDQSLKTGDRIQVGLSELVVKITRV
ncbi:MAG: FHA domain-containing protein [Acidobacteriaceae bacterium]